MVAGHETLEGRCGKARVGDARRRIRKGELDRLQDEMLRQGLIVGDEARQIEAFENAERHQGDDALSVGRQFENRVVAIIAADRLDPFGLDRIEVVAVQIAAVLPQNVEDPVPDIASIEGGAAVSADSAPGPRKVRLTEDRPRRGRSSARQIGGSIGGEASELRSAPFPRPADFRPDREPFLRVSRRGLDEVGKIHRTEALMQGKIAVESAGDRDGRRAGLRH